MAEIKRNFTDPKMNKDMDERVLPSGQYRDANNIQVATSDGSDVGSLQTLLGNTKKSVNITNEDYSTCVGAMALPEKDLVYYFVHGGGAKNYEPLAKKDYIIEYDTISNTFKYVFVDIYSVKRTQSGANTSDKFFTISDLGNSNINTTNVRVGMLITGTFNNGNTVLTRNANVRVTDIVHTGSNTYKIYHDYLWDNGSGGQAIPTADGAEITFLSEERVLEFDYRRKIHSINHLGDMIFWTDGKHEPKKIHIERSILGTGGSKQVTGWTDTQLGSHSSNKNNANASLVVGSGDNEHFHTRLVIDNEFGTGFEQALNKLEFRPHYTTLENVTVIKKSPLVPLKLEMLQTTLSRVPDATTLIPNPSPNAVGSFTGNSTGSQLAVNFCDGNGEHFKSGYQITNFFFSSPVDFRIGDTILFSLSSTVDFDEEEETAVRALVKDAPTGMPNNGGSIGPYNLEIESIVETLACGNAVYAAKLESPPPLFEFKFPRFSYRYKYQDGEYSTFAPFTEVAFLPGGFDYKCKKGFNLGMTNRLRSLRLTDYFPEFELIPRDVIQVDLLYKEDASPTIYTVKEIKRKDGAPQWPDMKSDHKNRGQYDLTSEMIHAVVPSNQILRPYDNVPKSALTQEITSNRLIYGNYKQGYDINESLRFDIQMCHDYTTRESQGGGGIGLKSNKTLRTYQLGIVFGDKYGRETPVQIPNESSSIFLEKKWSAHSNRLQVTLRNDSGVPSWADYFKWYVKETSNEYYNFAMDRWYDAEDGNIWISIPSAERNKIDEETFLILKNAHDTDKPVYEKARYKVIAISEDAPLFVKTNKKIHGDVQTQNQTGTALAAANEILITNDTTATPFWNNSFGSDWLEKVYSKISRGNLEARVTATSGSVTKTSEYRKVTSIRTIGNDVSVRLAKPIGDSADMTSSTSNPTGLTSPTYKVTIRELVVENSAEFDGRFFVKIFRDDLLEKYVLTQGDQRGATYQIVQSHQTLYISGIGSDNDRSHPSRVAPLATGATHLFHRNNCGWYGSEASSPGTTASAYGQNDKFNATHRMGHSGNQARERTRDYWVWSGTYGNEWFIDACGHRNDHGWSNGNSFHPNDNHNDNGTHHSHSDINGEGKGGLKHSTTDTTMYWGIREWGNTSAELGNQRRVDFEKKMRKAGTLFRWRNDPTNTVYRVIADLGARHTRNALNNKNFGSNRRRQFVNKIVQHENNEPMDMLNFDPLSLYRNDGYPGNSGQHYVIIDFVEVDTSFVGSGGDVLSTDNPAIWETEPKEDVGLDIYYEASGAFPLVINADNNEHLIPLESIVTLTNSSGVTHQQVDPLTGDPTGEDQLYTVTAVNSTDNPDLTKITLSPPLIDTLNHDQWIRIERYDGTQITVYVSKDSGNYAVGDQVIDVVTGVRPTNTQSGGIQWWRSPRFQPQKLGWYNCFQFQNGVESDRIRDDFNAPTIANGVKASTVAAEPYSEEHRSSGLIFSGIFNSTSGVNNLNQFIQAEPITKDLSPRHGSIQKLISRDTDTLVFCEDKVLRILTNKDALFNADGNANVTSNNAVLGQATPINGEYGISTNPESLAVTPFGMYWCDQMRGQVLSLEGGASIRVISDIGMKDYFNDNLKSLSSVVGSYDEKKNEYNITLCTKLAENQLRPTTTTLSWNELTSGWVSFKSFGPEVGLSLNNEYYTFDKANLYLHHSNTTANNFYGTQYYSDVTLMFNDQPGSVKSFNTINYEGTQAKIEQFTTVTQNGVDYTDKEYYNLTGKEGWYVDSMTTDLQDVDDVYFKNKEGKWFGNLTGITTTLANLDEREFSVQGLGNASTTNSGNPTKQYQILIHSNATNVAGSTNWDSSLTNGEETLWRRSAFNSPYETPGVTHAAGYKSTFFNNMIMDANTGVFTYSGYDLDAAHFIVPGGTATTSGSGNSTVYTYTAAGGWNADTGITDADGNSVVITKVEFRNQGIAGDPANVVEARAYHGSFKMPANDFKIYFDVDNNGNPNPPNGSCVHRDLCVYIDYEEHSNDNVTITRDTVTHHDVDGNVPYMLTVSDNVTGIGNPIDPDRSTDKYSGQIPEEKSCGVEDPIVAQYTITAANGMFLEDLSSTASGIPVTMQNNTPSTLATNAYENAFSMKVTPTYYTSSGNTNRIQSAVVTIHYHAPMPDEDPADMCSLFLHLQLFYSAKAIPTNAKFTKARIVPGRIGSGSSRSGTFVPQTITHVDNSAGQVMVPFTTFSYYPTSYTGPSNGINHYYYVMCVKLNTAQNGITHAYNWRTDTFDAMTDPVNGTGTNDGPLGVGNVMQNNGTANATGFTIATGDGTVGNNVQNDYRNIRYHYDRNFLDRNSTSIPLYAAPGPSLVSTIYSIHIASGTGAHGTYCVFFGAGDALTNVEIYNNTLTNPSFTGSGPPFSTGIIAPDGDPYMHVNENLDIDTSSPTTFTTAINPGVTSFTVGGAVAPTVTAATMANVTTTGSTVNLPSLSPNTAVPASSNINKAINFTFTANSGTVSIVRQPIATDFLGVNQIMTQGGEGDSGDNQGTVIHVSDTTGIKVGMTIEDVDFEEGTVKTNRITTGTKIATVNTNDSVVLDRTTKDAIANGSKFRVKSDYEYEYENLSAVFNPSDSTTIINVTGNVKILKYGTDSPDGNIVLQPSNFITHNQ